MIPIFLPLVYAGYFPTFLLRFAAKHLCGGILSDSAKLMPTVSDEKDAMNKFVKELKSMPIAINTKDANDQHYEVKSEFMQTCLGPRLKYSCCYYPNGDETLAEAEVKALELLIQRAKVKDGMKILELGCGWGSICTYIAAKFPTIEYTAVSNSESQKKFIDRKGLKNLNIITSDVNDFEPSATDYDLVISIEMFEHMKNYEKLMNRISTWLKPEGNLFVHIFSHKKLFYHFTDGWMADNFFTGGTMPSDDLLLYFQKDLKIASHWVLDGQHYEKTSNHWLKNMDDNKDKCLELLSEAYGKDKAMEEFTKWRLFYIACAELFGYSKGQEWMVSHYLFEKPALHILNNNE